MYNEFIDQIIRETLIATNIYRGEGNDFWLKATGYWVNLSEKVEIEFNVDTKTITINYY